MTIRTSIKCGNIDMGVYLLDNIKKLVAAHTKDSLFRLADIHAENHTWIIITLESDHKHVSTVEATHLAYVRGMVSGLLIQAGVEVI